ncbi:MAG: glycosyltransferase family 2 protein [Alphaproteobacteria bacterium]|nr:glycosyltransferase family 2 protein [Alphaproteobacteria bacterium]
MAALPRLDIVVVNWNSGPQLRRCLESIVPVDRTGFALARVVVVDNGSVDASLAGARGLDLPLTAIELGLNAGFAAACNAGARGSTADYVLFLNPDAALYPDSLSAPIRFLEAPENGEVGILGVQLVDDRGEVSRTCANFLRPRHVIAHTTGLNHLAPHLFPQHFMIDFDHRSSRFVDQVMGAFFLMRRKVLEALGGWDERFFVYLEDVDLAYRAKKHGWLSYFFAEARAYHRGGGVSRQVKAARLFYSLRSRILYAFKHFHPLVAVLLLLGTLFVEPLTRLVYAALGNSPTTGGETLKAYWLLIRDLPFVLSLAWTLRHHADTSARALRPAGR